MRNKEEIKEYLNVNLDNEIITEKTIIKAIEIEKKYEKDIALGIIGYGLICDFENNPFILEDEDTVSNLKEIEKFSNEGLIVYEIEEDI